MIYIKSKEDIEIMRKNGKLLAQVHELIMNKICPGVETLYLNKIAEEWIQNAGAVPSFKGYRGFPASICVSIDSQLIHGIPSDRTLVEGQIISVDIGLYKDGFHADAARTWVVGYARSVRAEYLVQSANRILQKAVEFIHPGIYLGDLSYEIEASAKIRGYEVVSGYGGHGIGRNLHEEPHIPNYGKRGTGPILKEGMVLAIEPMIMMGSPDVEVLDGGWTVVSKDRKLNAHAEDTVVVTASGCEILTRV